MWGLVRTWATRHSWRVNKVKFMLLEAEVFTRLRAFDNYLCLKGKFQQKRQ